ncbi:hypothetical protein HT031_006552 [Scenedesmus sp. PABB004]|nr:hypothetical protein HT031_006552 [Scenedesmus sp. PABB004]
MPRVKTPVGGAPPRSRAGSSAHHRASVQAPGALPDDDSLVLFGGASAISAQASQASVASGRQLEGDTFLTALRREPSLLGLDSEMLDAGGDEGLLSDGDSRANPMLSPGSSAFFSASASDRGDAAAGLGSECSCAPASTASAESSFAGGPGNGGGLPPSASLRQVIEGLYCSQPSPRTGLQQGCWGDLGAEGRPLLAHGGLAAAPAGTAAQGAAAPVPDAAAVAAADKAQPAAEPSRAGSLVSQGSSRDAAVPRQQDATQHERGASHEQEHQAPAADEQGGEPAAPDSDCMAQVEAMLAKRGALEAELSTFVADLTAKADEAGEALVELPADFALTASERGDCCGAALGAEPASSARRPPSADRIRRPPRAAQVERMLRARRSEYRALDGWEGPHRYAELPVAQLAAGPGDDQRLAAGLEVIRQLDEQLREAWLKALVAARGAGPEQWAEAEARRLARRAAQLDAALERERGRRLHAARLLRALAKLDEAGDGAAGAGSGPSRGGSHYRLAPADEALLAAVLRRDDATLAAEDPFDASAACLPEDEEAQEQRADGLGGGEAATPAQAPCCRNSTAGGAAPEGDATQAGCRRPSTAGSARSGASAGSARRRTVADIDALLAAMGAGQQRDQAGIATPATLSSKPSSRSLASDRRSAAPVSPARRTSRMSSASGGGGDQRGGSGAPREPAPQAPRDYVREAREARELAQRERDVDARLRALRTSELPERLSGEALQALLAECAAAQGLPAAPRASCTAAR